MSRFLVLVVVTLALSRDGCYGNERITRPEDLSDGDYADSEVPVKRASYQLIRSTDAVTVSDHPNVCHFFQDGAADGQILCRLRFTRSKFNFNPFGLRFGKREQSAVRRRSGSMIPHLLRPPCSERPAHRC